MARGQARCLNLRGSLAFTGHKDIWRRTVALDRCYRGVGAFFQMTLHEGASMKRILVGGCAMVLALIVMDTTKW